MNADSLSRALSPLSLRKSKFEDNTGDNCMSMGDKRRHKRGVFSNGRCNSRMKRKMTKRKSSLVPE